MTQPSDPRDDLRDLDQRITELSAQIDQLRADLTSSGPMDSEERAATLTNIEELEGSLDGLRRRRETVQAQLDR